MGLTKELYQEMIERDLQIEAEKAGLTVEDLLIMKDEAEAQERYEFEREAEAEEFAGNYKFNLNI